MCSSVLNINREGDLNKMVVTVLDFESSRSGINIFGRSIQILWANQNLGGLKCINSADQMPCFLYIQLCGINLGFVTEGQSQGENKVEKGFLLWCYSSSLFPHHPVCSCIGTRVSCLLMEVQGNCIPVGSSQTIPDLDP